MAYSSLTIASGTPLGPSLTHCWTCSLPPLLLNAFHRLFSSSIHASLRVEPARRHHYLQHSFDSPESVRRAKVMVGVVGGHRNQVELEPVQVELPWHSLDIHFAVLMCYHNDVLEEAQNLLFRTGEVRMILFRTEEVPRT